MDKVALRRSLLKARQAIPPDVWRHKSDRLCAHLQAWLPFMEAKTVLAYFSFRQEPDLSPLFQSFDRTEEEIGDRITFTLKPSLQSRRRTKRWGFPRCVGKTSMIWHEWGPGKAELPLQVGSYGITEPHPDALQITPAEVDLILVPAVACDVKGYRLGYGGGYYDRLLSHPAWSRKLTIGIVFEYARLPRLPLDSWDRPLSGICTEAGLFLPQELAS